MFFPFKSFGPQPVIQDMLRILYMGFAISGGIALAYWLEWLFRSIE